MREIAETNPIGNIAFLEKKICSTVSVTRDIACRVRIYSFKYFEQFQCSAIILL